MRYATTRQASQLTGLSVEMLREWTIRRALIPADIRPRRKGSPAKYTWQTILVLRLAVTLRSRFHLELQAHKALFDSLRRELRGKSFIALWDYSLVMHGGKHWSFLDNGYDRFVDGDAILIRLDPHLRALSAGFALPEPASTPGQLDLFPVQAVTSGSKENSKVAFSGIATKLRRRSA